MTSFHILFPLSEEYGSYHFPTTHHISRRYSDSRPSALTLLDVVTDYEHQERAFSKIPNFWAWADKLSRKFWGHLGYFRLIYQHPFWYCTVSLLSMFSIKQPLFLQKTNALSFYKSQNVLWRSKFFEPAPKFDFI